MKTFEKAYTFAFYPTKSQKKLLETWFEGSRKIYNLFLENQKKAYEAWEKLPPETRGKTPYQNFFDMSKILTVIRPGKYEWLNATNSDVLRQSLKYLDQAFISFFNKKAKFPKFKSCSNKQSLTATYNSFGYNEETKELRIAKKRMKLRGGRVLPCRPLRITIIKETTGKYYVKAICRVTLNSKGKTNKKMSIGIDLGIKEFLTDSNGKTEKILPVLKPLYRKLYQLQSKHTKIINQLKKTEFPNKSTVIKQTREKHRKIRARAHAKIVNVRKDFIHKLTTELVNKYRYIGIESLSISRMAKSPVKGKAIKRNLRKNILQSSWGEFVRQLKYKATWDKNTKIIMMHPLYPSTQIHSKCGIRAESKIPLISRTWFCNHCKGKHKTVDRDHNAAINIKKVTDNLIKSIKKIDKSVIIADNE